MVTKEAKSLNPTTRHAHTIPETADALSISARSVWRLIAAGELKSIRIGRARRVCAASLSQFVAKGGA